MIESNKFWGKYVDVRKHWSWSESNDIWELLKHESQEPLVIGSREFILEEYDKINESGVIPRY